MFDEADVNRTWKEISATVSSGDTLSCQNVAYLLIV